MSSGLAILYAVVVGWNGSPSPDVARLRYADDDAAEYARLFRDAGAQVTLLTALDEDSRTLQADARVDGPPTREALLGALARVDAEIERSGQPGELFIVYSGHGDVDHGEGFVQLDGARLTRGDLYGRVLGPRRARRTHVIVDACQSYFLVHARGAERRRHAGSFAAPDSPEQLPNVGFLLSTSSGGESHEWEDFQGGVFSHEVRSGLRGAADADADGQISYAELGAFVARANASIANPRYRPRYAVLAPPADSAGLGAAIFSWASGEAAAPRIGLARRVVLDVPDLGHLSVEDALGRRLADAHLAATRAVLHLPSAAPLYVHARGGDREYLVPHGDGPIALSSLSPTSRKVASRGALGVALGRLFALPFEAADVGAYLAHPPEASDLPSPQPSPRRIAFATTLGIAIATLVGGAGSSIAAAVLHGQANSPSATQADRVAANGQIAALNGTAIGLYVTAGAATAAFATIAAWPKPRQPLSARLLPGPGAVGLSFGLDLP